MVGNKQLEFTRKTNYLPKLVTKSGNYVVDDFFPHKDIDFNFEYSFVRILEQNENKIVM